MPPNVVCVVFDTARRDAFEPYGAPAGCTPATAQLAARGTAVEHAYAAASWTVPSHASMFTGRPSRALGLGQAPGGTPRGCRTALEAQRDRLLPEVLRRDGYETAAVSANLWISPDTGFDLGFERFHVAGEARQGHMDRRDLRARASWALETARARVDDGAADAERTLESMIAAGPQRPFFWFVNLVECHSPYLPPRPYNDLGLGDRLRAGSEAQRHLSLGAIWKVCAGGWDIPEPALRRMRHLYERSIRYLDDWLGRLLERLDAARLLDDTLVIVTSDHGENLGEGRLIGHAFSLDERLIRVPLVMAGPDAGSPAGGVVSLMDLPRLIASAAGLESHPWEEPDLPPGVALAQFDPPTGPDDPRSRQAIEEWGLDEEALARITSPLTCATDGRHKLLRMGSHERLYDLEADPLETSPLASANGDPGVAALRDALRRPLVWTAGNPGPVAETADDLGDIERQMKLLGYL